MGIKRRSYIGKNNPFYGKTHTKKTKKKISLAHKGKKLSKEHIEKIKGHIPWNKGKKGLQIAWNKGKKGIMKAWNKGKKVPQLAGENNPSKKPEVRRKISKSKMGFKHSKETIEKMRKSKLGRTWEKTYGKEKADKMKKKMSKVHKNKPKSEKYKQKIRDAWKRGNYKNAIKKGMAHPCWKGGISKLPYAYNWKRISKRIRKRDNFICQLCGDKILKNTEEKFLTAHHINYDKLDNRHENLIALCNFCNISVNKDREDWTKYFQDKIGGKK